MAHDRSRDPSLPGFTPEGVLPPGDYEMTLEELRASVLVEGPGPGHETWDTEWRQKLVEVKHDPQ